MRETVGILHPGEMGAAVAGCIRSTNVPVLWCSAGRGVATRERARGFGLEEVETLGELVGRSSVVISLCPPAGAEDVARDVAEAGFTGLYLDGNAISTARMRRICSTLSQADAVVDGSVIGSPPSSIKRPTLYLAGSAEPVARMERLFAGTSVRTHIIGSEVGQASALKLAYTAFQKTSRVLVGLAYALARAHGVDDELFEVAGRRAASYLAEPGYVTTTAARAWRWGPELREAADELSAAGLPPEVLATAAETLDLWQDLKDREGTQLAEVLDRLGGR